MKYKLKDIYTFEVNSASTLQLHLHLGEQFMQEDTFQIGKDRIWIAVIVDQN